MTALWLAFKASKLGRTLALIGGAVLAALFVLGRAKRQGAKEAVADAKEADHARAKEIRNDVEQVRRDLDGLSDDDMDERLRSHRARRD